jgi:epoxyqueuosine reductase
MILDKIVEEFARNEDADFYGVADLNPLQDVIRVQDEGMTKYPRAISMGIILLDSIIDQLISRFERNVMLSYLQHYEITNQRLDLLAARLASKIQKLGYEAFPMPASGRVDDEKICAVFSHKLAANQAGLGWIGKSCLLITQEAGPRVRWVTVLTDAPLKVSEGRIQEECSDCRECVEICPVNAFTGKPFHENEPRETRYDARKCEKYLYPNEKESSVCGLCIYVCPHGRNK